MDGRALCATEIHVPGQFYDFDAKYKVGGSRHTVPADVPDEVTELACGWAERAFTILGCRGVARADFIRDEDGDQLYMLEVNTQPGMTATSLTPEQAAFVAFLEKNWSTICWRLRTRRLMASGHERRQINPNGSRKHYLAFFTFTFLVVSSGAVYLKAEQIKDELNL